MVEIKSAVIEKYSAAAREPKGLCCPSGYDLEELRKFIPEEVLGISYGCGAPAGMSEIRPGDSVLDIGSGGGIDAFDAARRVGESGRVIGVDMTDEMLEMARRNAPLVARNLGYSRNNIEFRKGEAEALPVESESIDIVISNCVINLTPNKDRAFREIYRVLKEGGRFTISDIVADQPVPNYLLYDSEKWGECLSGALQIGDYLNRIKAAGFRAVRQLKFSPWKIIDGISFFSITLTGYKPAQNFEGFGLKFATLRGPFSRATDELGNEYLRGEPREIDAATLALLNMAPYRRYFVLSRRPEPLSPLDSRYLRIAPENKPCVWKGDYAILVSLFETGADDDNHIYRRGEPLEICSKTLEVLRANEYAPLFSIVNRASGQAAGREVICGPDGGCC